MKHQLTLRQLLSYVALFAVGLGMFRFYITSFSDAMITGYVFLLGVICITLAAHIELLRQFPNKRERVF